MNILLDLDGTLTDPSAGFTASIRYALEELGEEPPSDEVITQYIGPPLHHSIRELLATDDQERIDLGIEKYRERYREQGLFENSVYPGIPRALNSLVSRGARLFLATSKPRVYAEKIIDRFNLGKHLESVWGSELDGQRTDKAELIAYILRQTEIDPAETMMVGDRKHDALGAKANGLPATGVLWGFGSKEELNTAGCAVLLKSPDELGEIDL